MVWLYHHLFSHSSNDGHLGDLKILLLQGSNVHPWAYLFLCMYMYVQNIARRGVAEPNDVCTLIDAA